MDGLELLTVPQASEALCMSEPGIRRLVKSGKLTGFKDGGRLLIKPEGISAYIAKQPHPPVYMSAMRHAHNMLGQMKALTRYGRFHQWGEKADLAQAPFTAHLLRLKPLMEDLLIAIKAKDYAQADERRAAMWRETVDYDMLYKPISSGEVRRPPERPDWTQGLLFEEPPS